jgi:uncharacterized protein DUF4062
MSLRHLVETAPCLRLWPRSSLSGATYCGVRRSSCDNLQMRVFVSSLISGFEPLREAAAAAITTLGDDVVRAEDFQASPDSPQQACLAGVREADAVVLILGGRYGFVQQSGLSATHEEYREARDMRPVLVFIQNDAQPEPKQAEFLREVRGWERGHYTVEFSEADDLRTRVTRALHEFSLASESSPMNEIELLERAQSLLPSRHHSNHPQTFVAVAPGPIRSVLRPAELEDEQLRRFLLTEALTGDDAVLTPSAGTDEEIRGDTIQLRQAQAERFVSLDESGRLLIAHPALEADRWRTGIASIIEEDVVALIERSMRFAARVLDRVDQPRRLTHVALVVAVVGSGYLPWRTRAQHQASPNSAGVGLGSSGDVVVSLTPPVRRRAALVHDTAALAQDFAVRIRRERNA